MFEVKRSIAQAVALGLLAGCSGTLTQHGYLSSYDGLNESRGLGSRRLVMKAPVALKSDTRIAIDDIVYAPGAVIDPALTPDDRDLVLNLLGRRLCQRFARQFVLVPKGTAGAMRLRAAITEIKATSRASAFASTATSLLPDLLLKFPVPAPIGIRLPVGLGALTTEMELVDPDGKQVAAMVLHRQPTVLTSASISRIGDAYRFAGSSAKAFVRLVASEKRATEGGANPEACAAYGRAPHGLAGVADFIGAPVSPHTIDKGAAR